MGSHSYTFTYKSQLTETQIKENILETLNINRDPDFNPDYFRLREHGDRYFFKNKEEAEKALAEHDGYNQGVYTFYMDLNDKNKEKFNSLKTVVNLKKNIQKDKEKLDSLLIVKGFLNCNNCKSRINGKHVRVWDNHLICPLCNTKKPQTKQVLNVLNKIDKNETKLKRLYENHVKKKGSIFTMVQITSDHY